MYSPALHTTTKTQEKTLGIAQIIQYQIFNEYRSSLLSVTFVHCFSRRQRRSGVSVRATRRQRSEPPMIQQPMRERPTRKKIRGIPIRFSRRLWHKAGIRKTIPSPQRSEVSWTRLWRSWTMSTSRSILKSVVISFGCTSKLMWQYLDGSGMFFFKWNEIPEKYVLIWSLVVKGKGMCL